MVGPHRIPSTEPVDHLNYRLIISLLMSCLFLTVLSCLFSASWSSHLPGHGPRNVGVSEGPVGPFIHLDECS